MSEVLYAERDGSRLGFAVGGGGPALLLLQGLGYARWGWEPVVAPLARRFTVVAFDNRGIGDSDVPPGPYTTGMLAEDAVAVLDAAGFEAAHVMGASLGGMAAQVLAAHHPDRVRRLVLACTTPGGDAAHPIPEPTRELLRRAPGLPRGEAMRAFVTNALSAATVRDRPDLVDHLVARRLGRPPDPDGWQAQAAAATAHDAWDDLAGITAPTLVLHGGDDRVIDPRNADLLGTRIPGARTVLFDGLGHLFFWEAPDRVADVVATFLTADDHRTVAAAGAGS